VAKQGTTAAGTAAPKRGLQEQRAKPELQEQRAKPELQEQRAKPEF